MSEVQQQDSSGSDRKHKKLRAKKASTHIDMTPMVDLAFLLLTFFMLTTTFSKPKRMDITMPTKEKLPEDQSTKFPESQTMNILLGGDNKIIWYMGREDGEKIPETFSADFSLDGNSSIHKVILDHNKYLYDKVRMVLDSAMKGLIPNKPDSLRKHKQKVKIAEKKKGLMVLIKPDEKSKYKNLVDMLDEMAACNVATYAIVDLSENEKNLLNGIVPAVPNPEK